MLAYYLYAYKHRPNITLFYVPSNIESFINTLGDYVTRRGSTDPKSPYNALDKMLEKIQHLDGLADRRQQVKKVFTDHARFFTPIKVPNSSNMQELATGDEYDIVVDVDAIASFDNSDPTGARRFVPTWTNPKPPTDRKQARGARGSTSLESLLEDQHRMDTIRKEQISQKAIKKAKYDRDGGSSAGK